MKRCLLALLLLLVSGTDVVAGQDASPTERIQLEVTTASDSQDSRIGTVTDTDGSQDTVAETPVLDQSFQQEGLLKVLPVDQPAVVIPQQTALDGETPQTTLTQPIAQIQPIIQNPDLLQTINAGAEQTVPIVQPEMPEQVVEGLTEADTLTANPGPEMETGVVSDPLASSVMLTSINNVDTNAVMVQEQQQPGEITITSETTSDLVTSDLVTSDLVTSDLVTSQMMETDQSTLPSTDISSGSEAGSNTLTYGVLTPPVNYDTTTSESTTTPSTILTITSGSATEENGNAVLEGYVFEEDYHLGHEEENSAEAGMEKELKEEEEELKISAWTDALATTQVIAVILVVMACIIVMYILYIAKKKVMKSFRSHRKRGRQHLV